MMSAISSSVHPYVCVLVTVVFFESRDGSEDAEAPDDVDNIVIFTNKKDFHG